MKKIGIVFAMIEELDSLKCYLENKEKEKIFELDFYKGNISNVDVVLVESGIGKVNAARTTQILIDYMKVDCIFNVGVAGGIDNSLSVGDIVIGENIVQHDFDITVFGHNKGYIPNVGDTVKSDSHLVDLVYTTLVEIKDINVKKGTIASGDIFCTEEWMSKKINKKFNALACEMEGASIAQVCFLCNVPFVIIRSISDVVNNKNVVSYEKFLLDSCQKVGLAMKNALVKISQEELEN